MCVCVSECVVDAIVWRVANEDGSQLLFGSGSVCVCVRVTEFCARVLPTISYLWPTTDAGVPASVRSFIFIEILCAPHRRAVDISAHTYRKVYLRRKINKKIYRHTGEPQQVE